MRSAPQRSCIGCRTVRDKRDLVRLVFSPDERLALDPSGKAPGRGAYLCKSDVCLAQAVKRKALERAFRQPLPQGVVAELETGMRTWLAEQPTGTEAARAVENAPPTKNAGADR
jgi:predicted RNA-binding protein YlxR (DUF448 family)